MAILTLTRPQLTSYAPRIPEIDIESLLATNLVGEPDETADARQTSFELRRAIGIASVVTLASLAFPGIVALLGM